MTSHVERVSGPFFKKEKITGWITQFWVYHQFISVKQGVSTLLQALDEATIHYELKLSLVSSNVFPNKVYL